MRFNDLVAFVDKQAKIATDPLFGELQGASTEKKEQTKFQKGRRHERLKGSSFATNVAAIDVNE